MYGGKWIKLKKENGCYELMPPVAGSRIQNPSKIYFTHVAFDVNDERLVATDLKGDAYCIDFSNMPLCYQKLGPIGHATFLAFNPINKCEVLIGSSSGTIKFYNIDRNMVLRYSLTGHKFLPINISFYKHYALTYSCKEVIIWNLQLCNRSHELTTNVESTTIKRACFSSIGHIIVLYQNDILQAWMLAELKSDVKFDLKLFGMQRVTDFIVTKDGRNLIITSAQIEVFILRTRNWTLLKRITLRKNFIRIKQLNIISSPMDDGANIILLILSTKGQLHLFYVKSSCFVTIMQDVNVLKKCVVSSTGEYIGCIYKTDCLKLIPLNKLIAQNTANSERIRSPLRQEHHVNDHLEFIRQTIKEELKQERLIRILEEFEKYPEKYRTVIWMAILKLPYNRKAYNGLTNKIRNGNISLALMKDYCLADRSKTSLLATILECLTEWCPFLAHVKFLPRLVFPFLMVYQKNLLLAFELIVTILFNYCQKWFEYEPLPPLNTLGIIENILLEVDPSLVTIFCEHGITSSDYAWPLMQSALSEVLSASEWLILWDHLISYQRPCLFLMCIVAYNISSRDTIISMLHSKEDLKKLYNMPSPIRAKDLLKVAKNLDVETPCHIHPSYYFRNTCLTLPSKGPYPSFTMQEYPNFLAKDSHSSQINKAMQQEQMWYQPQCHVINDMEDSNMHLEFQSSVKKVQRAQLDAQNSLRKHCDTTELKVIENDRKEYTRSRTPKGVPVKYKNLQQDVKELENEVQYFIASLRTQKLEDLI